MLRKTISFTEHYKEEYEYLCNQNNSSEYVCKLIKKDRLNQNDNAEDRILKLLNQIIKNGKVELSQNEVSHHKKRALKNILNM